MLLTDLEYENMSDDAQAFNSSWGPEDDNWDDDEDEDLDDRLEDLDDLHEVQVNEEDFDAPDPDDDDHLPEEEEDDE